MSIIYPNKNHELIALIEIICIKLFNLHNYHKDKRYKILRVQYPNRFFVLTGALAVRFLEAPRATSSLREPRGTGAAFPGGGGAGCSTRRTPLLREGRPADHFKKRGVSASHFDSACVKAWGPVSGNFSSPFGYRSQRKVADHA